MIAYSSSRSTKQRSMTHRLIACGLVLLLMAPLELAAAAQQPQQSDASSSSLPESPQPSRQQNAPGAQQAQAQREPQAREEAQAQQEPQAQQPANPAPAVGTAAAPYEKASGITATRPAGAVIAPAKQRRIHSILIKVGIVAGAGAAIAAVALLSHSSPSQPH